MIKNPLLLTDSYKVTHWPQYPKGTTKVRSYLESRGGLFSSTTFLGLQYILKEYFSTPITKEMVDEAEEIFTAHLGSKELFNRAGWDHIVEKHGGKLPILIKAVKEGTTVSTSNVLMTVENTDPACYWLPNYLETVLLQVWYPITVATLSREMKKLILSFLNETGDPALIDFKLHDFGYRGVSSVESAGIGGLAHLANFKGTDTVAALVAAKRYYGESMAGFSIPASEHSTITSWGKENEVEAMRNMIAQYGKGALYACVSDSYDIFNACENLWGKELRSEVLNANGTLVVRPDSGVPHVVVVKCLELLGNQFGYSINEKGFKVLNPKVRLIQGDGIDLDETRKILSEMRGHGWSADNVAFGMGGALLQKVNRDTQKFAFKCSSVTVNGQDRDVFKDPITDKGKQSKKGSLALVKRLGKFQTVPAPAIDDLLEVVYENGVLKRDQTLSEIRVLTGL